MPMRFRSMSPRIAVIVSEMSCDSRSLVTLLIDHLTLIVGDIIVFQQLLADVEIAGFDLALRVFNGASDPGMFNRLALAAY